MKRRISHLVIPVTLLVIGLARDAVANVAPVPCHAGESVAESAPVGATVHAAHRAPLTGTPLDFFTNYGNYVPRTHCMANQAGQPDWPWIIALTAFTLTVIVGYLRIVWFWRKAYLQEEARDRNVKLMNLAYIFLWCAVCGYAMALLSFVWPAYRLLTVFMVILAYITWRFIVGLKDFGISFSAKRLERLLHEQVAARTNELQENVRAATAELRLTNEQFRASEARFNQIVANVPGMVYQFIRRPSGAYEMAYVSDGIEKLYGVTAAEAMADASRLFDCVHADDRAANDASIEASYVAGGDWFHEWRIHARDGRLKWIRGQSRQRRQDDGTAVWDGVLIDITEAKAAAEALDQSRRDSKKLALVASCTGNAVIITDREGRIEWVNESFTRIAGYTLAEVAGRKPGSVLQGAETDRAELARVRHAVAAGEPVEAELVNYHKSGRPYWIRMEIQPVRDEAGAIQQFVAIETDVTLAKAHAAELARARDAAEAANAAKSSFLANMSHEIRTPLTGIIGFSQMLMRDEQADAATRRDWALTVHSGAKHLLTLINDVLDLSKIEAGKLEVERVPCAPHALLGEIASVMRVPINERGLELSLHYLSPLPKVVQTDPTRLRQILLNLVSNASKFTERGKVRIVASCVGEREHAKLCIRVSDTGIGMTREQVGRIFRPFVQADNTMTRRFGGTGLGLTISRHICEKLGGSLEVDSFLGVGSTFTATIDVGDVTGVDFTDAELSESVQPAPAQPQAGTSLPAKVATLEIPRPLAGRRVMVVDDGATNRKLLCITLKRAGATISTACNGREAIDAIAAAGGAGPEAILMDMQMPVLDGYSAAAELRRLGCTVPVIALTAHAMSDDRDRCLAAGCSDYLTKPVDTDELLRVVTHWVEAKPGATATPAAKSESIVEMRPATIIAPAEVPPASPPIASKLPMDDPEFAELAAEGIDTIAQKLAEFQSAAAESDWAELKTLAHWLKGVGGSAGYPDLVNAACDVESAAVEAELTRAGEAIRSLESLLPRCKAGVELTAH